ncbi:hypothetical protein PENARI_c034G01917 [Penicillium arizonense]|uniref:Reverse transcriptase Ty1/copia-type domain-containing protein n=1 Tax=Penicillium arizonense TaxID=1835702 RepID=A0A1F5L4N9_PENAI|nr:hypothetical protein PENARI_c034G01917 [Penicillium arizonense]OGE48006.1 hypothetical protein PENARI_c034G01917 [Penicillium arizonense]
MALLRQLSHKRNRPPVLTPLPIEDLKPYEGIHHRAVDRAITYLYTTRFLAIEYNAEKATKQRTVTTLTTEVELLGLSEAGKYLQWWRRLLDRVGFEASHVLTIEYDNERAIGLITTDDASFDTKLRHVDIHYL